MKELHTPWSDSEPHATGIVLILMSLMLLLTTCAATRADDEQPPLVISGRYPHLAMFNHNGECGIGAVVPFADRLWVITYGPHMPHGGDDKLYEIDSNLHMTARPESVGGTPANRMIHAESNQLVIGPYFIDAKGNVRAISPSKMPGRLTAGARALTDPANKVYILDMEGIMYEIDVHTLAVTKLFEHVAPGAHGKGGYTGQGRFVMANNGNQVVNKAKTALEDPKYKTDPEAAGILADWDGKNWSVIERREFTDITGPGGINGSPTPDAPLWAIGWDKRSVMLNLLDGGKWQTFRLPVADYSYVARHGWYTEWPRIREVGNGKFLMNMHGGWYDFPKTFSAGNTAGIRPLGTYLKITGDFAPWKDQIAFGCDDASTQQNPLLGQSQSNLWFSSWENLSACGKPSGAGGPWLNDAVKAGEPSTPYLFGGYAQRVVHFWHTSEQPIAFSMEIDADGKGNWKPYQTVTVPANGYEWRPIPAEVAGEWIRVKADHDCTGATAFFTYGPGGGARGDPTRFAALQSANAKASPFCGGLLRPLGEDKKTLQFEAEQLPTGERQLMELGLDMQFRHADGARAPEPTSAGDDKGYSVKIDEASVIVKDHKGQYRLPIAVSDVEIFGKTSPRRLREVVTERFLLNAGGSFFMVPRPTAGGAMRLKPVCTHGKAITDFCSWRGLMVIAGCTADAKPDGHYFKSATANGVGLWFGDIDDLWSMGKPIGHGGPWLKAAVEPGTPSDPYLMDGYDRKHVELSHDSAGDVNITLEVDVAADGTWHPFKTFAVPAGQTVKFDFPEGFSAHWVRASADKACRASAVFTYE